MKKAKLTDSGQPAVLDTESGELTVLRTPYTTILRDCQPWKTPYNHDTDAESLSTALTCRDPSKAQQQFAKDADINNILRKFMQTGQLTTVAGMAYQEEIDDRDLLDRMVTSWEVNEAWQKLTPEVRNVLRNPETFTRYVDHCLKSGEMDELVKLGLAVAQTPPEPPKPPSPPGGGSPASPTAAGAPSAPQSPPPGGQ